MRVIPARPPMFDLIDAQFHVAGKAIFFCWGDAIYNPQNAELTPALIAHERVHCVRQNGDPESWWRRYLDDPPFRLFEEIPAHQAEYREICKTANRNQRRGHFVRIAERLSSPLYGNLLTLKAAKKAISG